MYQGIIDYSGTEIWRLVFVCFKWQRLFQELFAPILNRIVAIAQSESSTPVILFKCQIQGSVAPQVDIWANEKKSKDSDAFLGEVHRRDHPVATVDYKCLQVYYMR